MILWEGVFGSLQPSGPRLRVERHNNERPTRFTGQKPT
jgi:hypothetical protein